MGAGATGKSSTAKFISDSAPTSLNMELPLIKSASRCVYEANDLNENKVLLMSPEDQLKLQTAIFQQKIINDQQYSYIADRTILDHYAYCLAYCGSHMSNELFMQFEEQVRALMLSTYSHIYFFPWGYWEPAEEDGVRSNKKAWQSQIDAIMVGYIVRWNLPAVWVPQDRGEDYRNEFVLSHLRGEHIQGKE
jgi:hypothetical protein